MKKIYSLVDKHSGTILYSAKTRKILEEIMCDDFLEDYQYEMQMATDAHFINPINPTEDCRQYARQTWNLVLNWHKEVYDIQRSNII